MLFEQHHEPLAARATFLRRVARNAGLAGALILGSLALGTLGYHLTEGLPWVDALLNASMLLGGMGPVSALRTTGGKLFASFYALFSGIVFLVAVGVLLAPLLHRFLHHFHLDLDDTPD
jgi:hypothetical protein